MPEIKVFLNQQDQNIHSEVYQTNQRIGVSINKGVSGDRIYHDETLSGEGTAVNVLRISQSILNKIDSYVFEQGIASNKWTITHNLNKYPSVMVVDSGNTVVAGNITYIDENTIEIEFNSSFKGTAYLN